MAAPLNPSTGPSVPPADAPPDAPVLEVTERAFRRVEELLTREGIQDGALRVGLKGGGCTGYQYTLGLEAGPPRTGDEVLTSGGATVVVDPKSARLLRGTRLDFTDGLNGQGFTFENPNATRTCGCGHSFSA